MEKRNKLIQEQNHDPYFLKGKYPDPSVCGKCGVVFRNGNFEWPGKTPAKAANFVCPACKRIAGDYEGGVVVLEGDFLLKHKNEILNIIKNTENNERKYRPLERIFDIADDDRRIAIKTTYEHIARRIGEAVHDACKGKLNFQYPDGEKYIRVHWQRND